MSKTAAIRAARSYVSIHGSGTRWMMIAPHEYRNPNGPSAEYSYDSFRVVQLQSARRKAEIALALMGKLTEKANAALDELFYDPWVSHSVDAFVAAGLNA